tara:strand:+ start:6117 stop:6395 length:279 start_codon:yes stop_codon:yes gene_type:complete
MKPVASIEKNKYYTFTDVNGVFENKKWWQTDGLDKDYVFKSLRDLSVVDTNDLEVETPNGKELYSSKYLLLALFNNKVFEITSNEFYKGKKD